MNNDINKVKDKVKDNIVQLSRTVLEREYSIRQMELEHYDLTKAYLLGIIRIIDSFEDKEENLMERNSDNESSLKIIQNFGSIKKKMLNLLETYGVTVLEFPDSKWIVGFSKPVETMPDPTKETDTIIEVVKKGYVRGSESIRDAEVIIVKN